jgi:two-component system, chemotaxis family, response regulator Rcp1
MVTILLVEEDHVAVRHTRDLLSGYLGPVELHVVPDGGSALAFLQRENPYASAPRPDFILLALAMLRKDGYALLREVQKDPQLKQIPLVVLPRRDTLGAVSQGAEWGKKVDR